jgi:hypothetical protein
VTGIVLLLDLAAAGAPGQHAAQAEQFLEKGWTGDAVAEAEEGLREPGGMDDVGLLATAARAHVEWLSIGRAIGLYERAASIDAARAESWRDTAEGLRESFGEVEITATSRRGALAVEAVDPVLDPVIRARIEAFAARVREGVELPLEAWLPPGRWRVNGAVVEATPGTRAMLHLDRKALSSVAAPARSPPRAGLALGLSALAGPDVQNERAAASLEIDAALPLGPAWIGAGVQWEPRAHVEGAVDVFRADAGSAAVRAGFDVSLVGPIALRPALGAVILRVPGIALDCAPTGAGYACGAEEGATVRTFVDGWAIAPAIEVGAMYRDPRRPAAPALGLRLAAGYLAGWVDAAGSLAASDPALGPGEAGYSVADPAWSAWLARAQLTACVPLR